MTTNPTTEETTMRVPPSRDGATPTDRTPEPVRGGPWTSHGHPVAGLTIVGPGRPSVARCGGPRMCNKCATESEGLMEAARIEDARWETITDRAAIRATDEPSERGDFPCCSGARAALDLDAIEADARTADRPSWFTEEDIHDALGSRVACYIAGMDPATALALVAEVRRLIEFRDWWKASSLANAEDVRRLTAICHDWRDRSESAEAEVVTLRAKVAAVEAEKEAILGQVDQAARMLRLTGAIAASQTVIAQVRRWPQFVDTAALATTGEGK